MTKHRNTPTHGHGDDKSRSFVCQVCGGRAKCSIKHCDGCCAPVHQRCLSEWRREKAEASHV